MEVDVAQDIIWKIGSDRGATEIPPFLDSLGTIASVASLPALVVTYLALIRKPGVGRTIILCIATPIAILAYGADVADRLGWIELSNRESLLLRFGRHNDTFSEFVNSKSLVDDKDHFHLMLILNVPYPDIDPMTDFYIEKSATYTITGGIITLAVKVSASDHLRVLAPPDKKLGDSFDVFVHFYIALIPIGISPEQIRSLSDVELLGGKIILASATNIGFTVGRPNAGGASGK